MVIFTLELFKQDYQRIGHIYRCCNPSRFLLHLERLQLQTLITRRKQWQKITSMCVVFHGFMICESLLFANFYALSFQPTLPELLKRRKMERKFPWKVSGKIVIFPKCETPCKKYYKNLDIVRQVLIFSENCGKHFTIHHWKFPKRQNTLTFYRAKFKVCTPYNRSRLKVLQLPEVLA